MIICPQDKTQKLDQANAESKYTHKNSAGQWVGHEKKPNPITATITRCALEKGLNQRG